MSGVRRVHADFIRLLATNRRSSHRFNGLPALPKTLSYFRSTYGFTDRRMQSIFGGIVAKNLIAQPLTQITRIKGANGFITGK